MFRFRNSQKTLQKKQAETSLREAPATTHKVMNILKMYNTILKNVSFGAPIGLPFFCRPCSHLVQESEPKCPTGSASSARSSKKPQKKAHGPRVSKYDPGIIKVALEGVQMQGVGLKICSPNHNQENGI